MTEVSLMKEDYDRRVKGLEEKMMQINQNLERIIKISQCTIQHNTKGIRILTNNLKELREDQVVDVSIVAEKIEKYHKTKGKQSHSKQKGKITCTRGKKKTFQEEKNDLLSLVDLHKSLYHHELEVINALKELQ